MVPRNFLITTSIHFCLWSMLTLICVTAHAQTPLGDFAGDPHDTWAGLKQLGLQVRTFEQPHLIKPDEKVLRRYLQYVPRSVVGHKTKRPLVIALPGADLSAEAFREWDLGDRLEQLAEKEKFILVYANAFAPSRLEEKNPDNPFFANGGYWRTCFGRPGDGPEFFTVDDVSYLRSVIEQVKREGLPVDSERIYLMGMSNGGEMAQRAAREMADELAGVGAVMPVNAMPVIEFFNCSARAQQPLAMMFIYSPKDTLLDHLYAEGGFNYGKVMGESVAAWRDALEIDKASEKKLALRNSHIEGDGYTGDAAWARASMNSSVTRYDYARARNGARFAVLEINAATGHAWPNHSATPPNIASEPYNGFKNQDIQAEEELWEFLRHSTRIGEKEQ